VESIAPGLRGQKVSPRESYDRIVDKDLLVIEGLERIGVVKPPKPGKRSLMLAMQLGRRSEERSRAPQLPRRLKGFAEAKDFAYKKRDFWADNSRTTLYLLVPSILLLLAGFLIPLTGLSLPFILN